MAKTIFIAEDDEGIKEVYECAFMAAGFDYVVYERAEELLEALNAKLPDVIVLDIMLPEMDGITALSKLKNVNSLFKHIPVVVISAKIEESVKVKSLTLGADDYITKPFGVMELVARINNILKRINSGQENLFYSYKNISIDDSKHKVTLQGHRLDLSPKEYSLLLYLIQKSGQVVKRDELLDKVWGENYYGETRTLDIHITAIRGKIAQISEDKYITTIRGVGFMLGE